MNLQKVRGNGCILYFPETLKHAELLRGGKGLVVDLDQPWEKEWCRGQEYKLEPAPEAKEATPITNRAALKAIAEWPTPEDLKAREAAAARAAQAAQVADESLEVKRGARSKAAVPA